MGHKNRANFKFWSHKKIFPPGRPGEGVDSMRTPADKVGRGQKLTKSFGRLLWMAPYVSLDTIRRILIH